MKNKHIISNVFKWLILNLLLFSLGLNEQKVNQETKIYINKEIDYKDNFISLEQYIKDCNYQVSVGYFDLKSDFTYKYNADVIYYGASLIKTLDALYVYENMELTKELKALVKPTIMVSNNETHRALVNLIGLNNLKEYSKKIGTKYVLQGSDYYGNITVDDELTILKYLYNFINDENKSKDKRRELKNYFINDHYNYLNFLDSPIILHKYGYYGIYFHDVGIVLDKNPYLIVILTKEGQNDFTIITDLAKKIYKLHNLG